MAESSGSNTGLYFIVGVLVAAVAVLAVLYFTGTFGGGTKKLDVNIKKGQVQPPALVIRRA